jgi:predicted Ser/Thr protein kinase
MSQTATCPRCQTPLATDAPEGLCPACLMAGGLASAPFPAATFASTTPWTDERRAAAIADLAPHFPQLEIIELLGQGGMGTVYKARQKHLDRLIALKVIPPEAAKEPAFAERFAREARALARLNHPNIVTVHDFGQSDGVYFLLMEFVDGLNLRQTMQTGNLTPQEALAIVPHICDALQYAHDQGIVHRDVKPENVLLDKAGRVKIADFGLAKLLTHLPQDFTLTHSMQVMGTPRYMAPEQIEHPTEVDHRADIYSLGVMFYEMLTGELPMGRFAPPSQKVQIDIRIDEIVLRSLEKEPARRYQHASEVKTELETVKSAPQIKFPLVSPNTSTPLANLTQGTAGRVLVIAIMVVFSLLMIGVGIMLGVMPPVLHASKIDSLGYFGAAFGCIVGGLGGLIGTLNTYRQMAGKPDWMEVEYRTWLDRVMLGYLFVGVAMLLYGWMVSSTPGGPDDFKIGCGVLILGAIIICQAFLFLIYRATIGRTTSGKQAPERLLEHSEIEEIRRRVAGPGTGLMIGGILGLLPGVLLMLGGAVLFFTRLTPSIADNRPPHLTGLIVLPMLAQAGFAPASMQTVVLWVNVIAAAAFQMPFAILMILGGRAMRRVDSYWLAVTAGVGALLPLGPAWIVSMPVGIWALIVLAGPEVRAGFRNKRGGSGAFPSKPNPDPSVPPLPAKPVPVDAWNLIGIKQQLFWPGMGLVGSGGLGLMGIVLCCLAVGSVPFWMSKPSDDLIQLGAFVLVLLIGLQLPWSLFMLFAGLKMKRMESYRLALAGACLALLPMSPASIVIMPLGIWAIVMLSSREVREAFRQKALTQS